VKPGNRGTVDGPGGQTRCRSSGPAPTPLEAAEAQAQILESKGEAATDTFRLTRRTACGLKPGPVNPSPLRPVGTLEPVAPLSRRCLRSSHALVTKPDELVSTARARSAPPEQRCWKHPAPGAQQQGHRPRCSFLTTARWRAMSPSLPGQDRLPAYRSHLACLGPLGER